MSTYRRFIYAFVAVTVVGLTAYWFRDATPPQLQRDGYTAATIEFATQLDEQPAITVSTDEPTIVQALVSCLATGTSVDACRCLPLATVRLARPDGRTFNFMVMPAHHETDVRIQANGRFEVSRNAFLAAVAPLGVPAERWTGTESDTSRAEVIR